MNVYQTLFLKRTYQVRLGILPSFCGLETEQARHLRMPRPEVHRCRRQLIFLNDPF